MPARLPQRSKFFSIIVGSYEVPWEQLQNAAGLDRAVLPTELAARLAEANRASSPAPAEAPTAPTLAADKLRLSAVHDDT